EDRIPRNSASEADTRKGAARWRHGTRSRRGGTRAFEARPLTRGISSSRQPRRSPSKTSQVFVSEILALRKQLNKDRFDAGGQTIHPHLARKHEQVPSPSTIWRVLKAEGRLRRTRRPGPLPRKDLTAVYTSQGPSGRPAAPGR